MLFSNQDLFTTSETATQVQFLAGHDDLMKNMLTIAKDDQVMRCDETSLTMAFLAGNQDPIVGRIDAIDGCVYSLGKYATFDITYTRFTVATLFFHIRDSCIVFWVSVIQAV